MKFWNFLKAIFGCKHPFASLIVEKDDTTVYIDEDFSRVTYYLRCQKCRTSLPVKYAKLNGGVDAFLERGAKKLHEDIEDAEQARNAE